MAFLALCGIALSGFAAENKIGRAPIIHGKNFRHEHELFNYDPGFYPNVVSFDKQNRPYIRSRAKVPCLQTIDQAGKLNKINFCAAIKNSIRNGTDALRLARLPKSGLQ